MLQGPQGPPTRDPEFAAVPGYIGGFLQNRPKPKPSDPETPNSKPRAVKKRKAARYQQISNPPKSWSELQNVTAWTFCVWIPTYRLPGYHDHHIAPFWLLP